MPRAFRIRGEDIRSIAPGFGGCIASDKITVDGERVGWMYREAPSNSSDTGWRFFSGTETQEYADEPANFEFYDVNTIANYDPDIVEFLSAATGSGFAREPLSEQLRPVELSSDIRLH